MAKALSLTPSTSTALVNISHYAGEDITLTCTFAAATVITGWTFTLTVRDKFGGTALFSASGTITDATNGVFTFSIASADTDGADDPGVYVYDIVRTNSSNRHALATGTWEILPRVTTA